MNAFVLFSVFRGYNIKEFRSLDNTPTRIAAIYIIDENS